MRLTMKKASSSFSTKDTVIYFILIFVFSKVVVYGYIYYFFGFVSHKCGPYVNSTSSLASLESLATNYSYTYYVFTYFIWNPIAIWSLFVLVFILYARRQLLVKVLEVSNFLIFF